MHKHNWAAFIAICAVILVFVKPVFAYEAGIIKTVRGQVIIERGTTQLEAKVGDTVQENDRHKWANGEQCRHQHEQ